MKVSVFKNESGEILANGGFISPDFFVFGSVSENRKQAAIHTSKQTRRGIMPALTKWVSVDEWQKSMQACEFVNFHLYDASQSLSQRLLTECQYEFGKQKVQSKLLVDALYELTIGNLCKATLDTETGCTSDELDVDISEVIRDIFNSGAIHSVMLSEASPDVNSHYVSLSSGEMFESRNLFDVTVDAIVKNNVFDLKMDDTMLAFVQSQFWQSLSETNVKNFLTLKSMI